jgi:hypothetical protein
MRARWVTPFYGQKRVVKKFLWLPKWLRLQGADVNEIRWLEKAEIEQEYGYTFLGKGWRDMWWVNN